MVGRAFSTRDVAPHSAFAYWNDLVCANFIRLECSAANRKSFNGSFELHEFGDLQISAMAADEMHVRRNKKAIGLSAEDYFIIPIQGVSLTYGAQDGREFSLRPGDFAVFDSTRPYEATLVSQFQHYLLRVPRALLKKRLGSIESLTGLRVPGDRGVGRIASAFLQTLPGQLPDVDHLTNTRLSETAIDLISMALAEHFGFRPDESSTKTAHKMRVRNFVEANLAHEDLSVALVAKALKLSPRYLNHLFSNEDISLGRYISDRRLEHCRLALGSPQFRGQTIAEIAYRSGFGDISHFSRLFRSRFGMSPREYRANGEPNLKLKSF
jgi:AraC-like DNA-binding protein